MKSLKQTHFVVQATYLLLLLCDLLLLLPLALDCVVVHLGLVEARDERVEDAEELVALRRRRVLAEHPAHLVELIGRKRERDINPTKAVKQEEKLARQTSSYSYPSRVNN